MYLKTELYELIRTDESIFDFIQESALDGLWYWDLENPENEWMNAKFWKVLGYNPDEMPHKSSTWQNIINKEDLEVVMKNLTKHCENSNHPYDQVVRYTHKKGSTVWIRCRGIAIRDKNGKPIRMLGIHHDITEVKQAEEKHVLSERTYKEIFNGIDDSLFIHEIGTGAILDVNDSMLKNFDYDRDDISKLTLADLSAPKEPYTNEHIGELIIKASKGETVVFEWLCRKKNGDLFYSENILKHVNIAGVERIMAIVRNITERKREEEELKTSDRIFKHSLDMLCIAGFDGYFKVLNPAWKKILGWSNEELLSKPWIDFVHPDDRDNTKYIKTVIVDGKEIYQFENRYICKDGATKWLSWNSFPYPEENIMFGVARDITASKQAEQELKKAKEKAEESEAKFRSLVELSSDGISLMDTKGNILFVNQGKIDMFGYDSAENLIGVNGYSLIEEKERQKFFALTPKFLEQGFLANTETRAIRKDGSLIEVEINFRMIYNENGKPAFIMDTIRDITERKRAEAKLQREQALYMDLVNALPAGMYRLSVKPDVKWSTDNWRSQVESRYVVDFVSDRFCEITGIDRQEFIANPGLVPDRIHPDDSLEFTHKNTAAILSLSTFSWEGRMIVPDKGTTWIRFESIPRAQENGEVIWTGIVYDISKRKQAEEEQFRFLNIIGKSRNEIYVFDENTLQIEFINQGALDNLGYTLPEMKSMTPLDIKPEFTEEIFREIIKPLQDGTKERLVFETVISEKTARLIRLKCFCSC